MLFRSLLRDFSVEAQPNPTLGGRVAAARALAQLGTDQKEEARKSAEEAMRLAPRLPEAYVSAATAAAV